MFDFSSFEPVMYIVVYPVCAFVIVAYIIAGCW